MSVTTDYLEKVKEKYNLENQNQLAVFLEVDRTRINHYYNRGSKFDLYMTAKVADLLEIPMEDIIVELGREMAKNEKEREFWKKKARIISICFLMGIAPISHHLANLNDVYYVKLQLF